MTEIYSPLVLGVGSPKSRRQLSPAPSETPVGSLLASAQFLVLATNPWRASVYSRIAPVSASAAI